MVGKGKQKVIEPPPVIRSGKNSFTVGSKFEAKDSLGKWYVTVLITDTVYNHKFFICNNVQQFNIAVYNFALLCTISSLVKLNVSWFFLFPSGKIV